MFKYNEKYHIYELNNRVRVSKSIKFKILWVPINFPRKELIQLFENNLSETIHVSLAEEINNDDEIGYLKSGTCNVLIDIIIHEQYVKCYESVKLLGVKRIEGKEFDILITRVNRCKNPIHIEIGCAMVNFSNDLIEIDTNLIHWKNIVPKGIELERFQ